MKMDHCIKLFTHEAIVHSQLQSIEKLLQRKVDYEISLNQHGVRSNIQFKVNPEEIELIKNYLGYTVYTKDGERWVPAM